jgi:hypothetical protein
MARTAHARTQAALDDTMADLLAREAEATDAWVLCEIYREMTQILLAEVARQTKLVARQQETLRELLGLTSDEDESDDVGAGRGPNPL